MTLYSHRILEWLLNAIDLIGIMLITILFLYIFKLLINKK